MPVYNSPARLMCILVLGVVPSIWAHKVKSTGSYSLFGDQMMQLQVAWLVFLLDQPPEVYLYHAHIYTPRPSACSWYGILLVNRAAVSVMVWWETGHLLTKPLQPRTLTTHPFTGWGTLFAITLKNIQLIYHYHLVLSCSLIMIPNNPTCIQHLSCSILLPTEKYEKVLTQQSYAA